MLSHTVLNSKKCIIKLFTFLIILKVIQQKHLMIELD